LWPERPPRSTYTRKSKGILRNPKEMLRKF